MQPKQHKSKVARFFPAYHYNYVINTFNNDIGQKLKNNLVSKQLAHPTLIPGWRLGSSESYALVSRGLGVIQQWYCKSGCCEGIRNFHRDGTIYYYIPNIGTLSKGKKIAYVAEVAKLLNTKIEFEGLQLATDGLSIPGSDRLYKPEITGDLHGSYDRPKVWGDFKEWLVFKTNTTREGQSLLILQFLRALYTNVGVNIPHGEHLKDKDRRSLYINQPHMYFRLKRWFPNLSMSHLMMLSYCISGSDNISSTYFPYYKWYYNPVTIPLELKNYNSGISINDWLVDPVKLSMVRLIMEEFKPIIITNEELLKLRPSSSAYAFVGGSGVSIFYKDSISGKVSSYGGITVGTAADFIIGKAFSKISKEGFKEAIILIAKLSGNEKLLKEIETQ